MNSKMGGKNGLMTLLLIFVCALFLVSGVFAFYAWWEINNRTQDEYLRLAKKYTLWAWIISLLTIIIVACIGGGLIYATVQTGGTATAMVAKAGGKGGIGAVTMIGLVIACILAFIMGTLNALAAYYISKSGFSHDEGPNQSAYKAAVWGSVIGIGGLALLVIGYILMTVLKHHKETKAKRKTQKDIETIRNRRSSRNTTAQSSNFQHDYVPVASSRNIPMTTFNTTEPVAVEPVVPAAEAVEPAGETWRFSSSPAPPPVPAHDFSSSGNITNSGQITFPSFPPPPPPRE